MIGKDLYLVVNFGTEGSDKVGGTVVEGGGTGDVSKEVLGYKFFLGAPDLPSFFVEDGVLVWVSLSLISTRQHSEEVREESEVDVIGVIEGGKRLYGGSSDRRWVAEISSWNCLRKSVGEAMDPKLKDTLGCLNSQLQY